MTGDAWQREPTGGLTSYSIREGLNSARSTAGIVCRLHENRSSSEVDLPPYALKASVEASLGGTAMRRRDLMLTLFSPRTRRFSSAVDELTRRRAPRSQRRSSRQLPK